MKGLVGMIGGLLPGRAQDRSEPAHIAFGTFCHVAAGLRAADLRRWTGPFDWIFSTPTMLAECLDDDCATLLDPRYLESVPAGERQHGALRQCRHRLFEERYGLPTLFNHHDPVGSAADRAALDRAVSRLLQSLRQDGENRLYMMSERPWPVEELEGLADRLARLPSRNTLYVIELDGRGWDRRASMSRFVPGRTDLVRVQLFTGTQSLGAKFPDPADDAHLAATLRRIAAHRNPEIDGILSI